MKVIKHHMRCVPCNFRLRLLRSSHWTVTEIGSPDSYSIVNSNEGNQREKSERNRKGARTAGS